jgi:hypothetical protein
MKNGSLIVSLLMTATAVFAPAARAQGQGGTNACTNAAVAGTYSVACSGFTALAAAGPLVPMMQVGIATGDADGNWSGTVTINIGGQVVIAASKVTGKANLNSDCTGTITYNKGTATELNISYVVNPRTDETFGLVTDKGTVVSCVLKRIKFDR